MKRDMDLVRQILLKIESEYRTRPLNNITVNGYDKETIAYHCRIMNEAGLVSGYKASHSFEGLSGFSVGPLTWEGCDYLDKIRDDSVWGKTKEVITKKGLPLVFDTIKTIAGAFITAAAEGVANSIVKNGGV